MTPTMTYPEIETAIAVMGSIPKAQEVLRLRYSDMVVTEGFSGDGINLFGFPQKKFSDIGTTEINGECEPFNADRTFFIVFQTFYEKSRQYKVDLHDAKTFKKVSDIDVSRGGTRYLWHPTDPFKLIWGEGNQLLTIHILTKEVSVLQTFSKPVEAGGKFGGGDGNHPDRNGHFLIGTKSAMFVYDMIQAKVIGKNKQFSPRDNFPTFSFEGIDYAQAFHGRLIVNRKPGGVWLANYDGAEIKQINRRGMHLELGFWKGQPGVSLVRHNDADAKAHGTESGRSYIVTWDGKDDLTWHPGDRWPDRLGGQTGGQLSWTERGVFVALHSRQEYKSEQTKRTNEVYQIVPGGARRLARHGINKAYSVNKQPEVKEYMFKGPDGWYYIDAPDPDPKEAIEYFLETGKLPDKVVDESAPLPLPAVVVEEESVETIELLPTPVQSDAEALKELAKLKDDYTARYQELQEKIAETKEVLDTFRQKMKDLGPILLKAWQQQMGE